MPRSNIRMVISLFATIITVLGAKGIIVLLLFVFVAISILKKLIKLALFLGIVAIVIHFGMPYFNAAVTLSR